jgi:hypothetical protein
MNRPASLSFPALRRLARAALVAAGLALAAAVVLAGGRPRAGRRWRRRGGPDRRPGRYLGHCHAGPWPGGA